jgi:hypothetical protein
VVWLSGLACGLVVAITPGLGLAAGGLLAPGLAALMLDKEAGRPIARAVLTCGVAGSVRPIMTLWNLGPTFDTALSVLFDPGTLVTAWGGAAAGWLLTQMAPLLTRMTLEAGAAAQTARLRATRARIADAWELDSDADESRETP